MSEATGGGSMTSIQAHSSSFNRDSSFEEILNAASRAERSLDSFLHHSGMRVIYESEASDVESEAMRSETFDSDFESLTSELDNLIEREEELRRELDLAEECCQEVLDDSNHGQGEIAGTAEGSAGVDRGQEEAVREHKREFADLLSHWKKAEETHTNSGLHGTMEDDSRWIITYSDANPTDSYSVRKGVTADRLRTNLPLSIDQDDIGYESSSSKFSDSFATVSDGGMDNEVEESRHDTENILDMISPEVFNKMSTSEKIAALEKAISLENIVALESIEALLAEALGESKVSEERKVNEETPVTKMKGTDDVSRAQSPPKKLERSQVAKGRNYYLQGYAKDDASKYGSVPSVLMLSQMSDERSFVDGSPDLMNTPIKELMWSITVSVADLLYGERPDSIEAAVVSKFSAAIGRAPSSLTVHGATF